MSKIKTNNIEIPVPSAGEFGQTGGNLFDKYGSGNPVVRYLMNGFLIAVGDLARQSGMRQIHEIGCGEGLLSIYLAQAGFDVCGCDVDAGVISEAEKNASAAGLDVPFRVASIYELTPAENAAELVVCCEVMEHLDDPETALEVLSGLAEPYLIFSVPREPLWRIANMARGKYWPRLGNTPGHVQNWSRKEFVEFLGRRLEIIRVLNPFPWTMVLARVKS